MVNDGAGHGYGDHVLEAVATAIGRQLRVADVLARQGGNEFILMLAAATSDRAAYEPSMVSGGRCHPHSEAGLYLRDWAVQVSTPVWHH